MIEKHGNRYELQCDYCCDNEEFDNFYDAVNHKKANGWKSENIKDEWFDKCPECLRK